MNLQNGSGNGTYRISKGEYEKEIQEVAVTYSNGQLHYEGELNPPFDEEIFNLTINRSYFQSLDVKETFKSAETELSDIVYKPENKSSLFKSLIKKFDLPEDTTAFASISHSGSSTYNFTIVLKSNLKNIQIDQYISLDRGGQ